MFTSRTCCRSTRTRALEITVSVDVPGYQPGQPLDMEGVTEGIIRRANALKTAGGGAGLYASYRLPSDNNLIINGSSSGTEGTWGPPSGVLLPGPEKLTGTLPRSYEYGIAPAT
ncbi:hypothetical protein [Streptomyces sp. NPDC006335]|uniref:hypothetical protein n=1 Tax=Streptomyces sp. NPDC006335 TaxID=3156895 RepID=UPI0033B543E8